ncbi:MAG: glutathione S-transferase family protein [Hyphomicrobiaceae bacterium]
MHRLTHFRLCPFSRSIRLLMAELKLETELHEEQPWNPSRDFLALNPAGDLPVLELDAGPVIAGAYAISEYLAETVDNHLYERSDAPIIPGNRIERAEIRRLIDWFHRKLFGEATSHLLEERVYGALRHSRSAGPDVELLKVVRQNLRYHLSYMSFLVEQRNWLGGEHMSFVDLAAAAHLSVADYLGEIAWDERQAVKSWYARMKSRPSLRAILAERVPGAPMPPSHYADPDF